MKMIGANTNGKLLNAGFGFRNAEQLEFSELDPEQYQGIMKCGPTV